MSPASNTLDDLKLSNALHLQALTKMKEESNKLLDAMMADARKVNEKLEKELREVSTVSFPKSQCREHANV